jgi:hypothetical protein
MNIITKTFHDVEHGDDVLLITDYITNNGGTILNQHHDYDHESLVVEFEHPDMFTFLPAAHQNDEVGHFFDF